MRSRAALTVITLLAVTGCSSTTQATPPNTTAIVSATTTPVATSPTPTTAATPSTARTTIAATTTSTLPITEQVRAAAIAYNEFYVSCLRNPPGCDPAAGTAPNSDAFNALTSTVTQLRAGGFFVGAEDPGTTIIESVEPMTDHTVVTQCHYTTMVLYGPPATEGGPPIVQNKTPGTLREALQFVQVADGTWKMRHGDTLLNQPGVNQCPS